jgi:hypothetical protein
MFRPLYRVIIRRTAPVVAVELQSNCQILVSHKEHYSVLKKCNKANVDAVVSSLFECNWCCVDGIFPI